MQRAWEPLPADQYETLWVAVDKEFAFKPHIKDFPGFAEPAQSITFFIGHIYGEPERYSRLVLDLSEKFLCAFQACTKRDEFLNVLDWQHPSYRFWPHSPFHFQSEEEWLIPILPNGDYYLFLEPNHSFGVLGHPWEKTMCIFGESLLEAIECNRPKVFDRVLRVGGKVV